MPEKFRQANKESFFSSKKISGVIGPVLFLIVALAGLFFWREKNKNISQVENSILPADRVLAAMVCRQPDCFWLNKEGVSFGQGGEAGGNIVIVLEDKTNRELKIGAQLVSPETLAKIDFFKNKLSEDFGLEIRSGETEDSHLADFDFTVKTGWVLRLNLAENVYRTLETLKQTLAEIKKTAPTATLEYVDLRIPNKVYYKFK